MKILTKKQLEILVSKQDQRSLNFYNVFWSYDAVFYSEVVQAYNKYEAHLKLINKGSMPESMGVDRYQFII